MVTPERGYLISPIVRLFSSWFSSITSQNCTTIYGMPTTLHNLHYQNKTVLNLYIVCVKIRHITNQVNNPRHLIMCDRMWNIPHSKLIYYITIMIYIYLYCYCFILHHITNYYCSLVDSINIINKPCYMVCYDCLLYVLSNGIR